MGTQYSLEKKLNWFRKRFIIMKEKEIFLNKKKLLAQFCLDNNSTERKGIELLKIFQTAGEISFFGENIGTPEQIDQEVEEVFK